MASSHKMSSRDRRRRKARLFGGEPLRPCVFCGVRLAYDRAVLDHKRPKARGGGDGLRNLHLACKFDNDSRGAKSVRRFREELVERNDIHEPEWAHG